MNGEGLSPAVKQFEEEEALASRDLVGVVDDEDVVRPAALHPRHAVARQEGAQVVVGDPAVLPPALGEMVQEHVQDLVAHVVISSVQEQMQKTATHTHKNGRTQVPSPEGEVPALEMQSADCISRNYERSLPIEKC